MVLLFTTEHGVPILHSYNLNSEKLLPVDCAKAILFTWSALTLL
jgi:hypothetical protein